MKLKDYGIVFVSSTYNSKNNEKKLKEFGSAIECAKELQSISKTVGLFSILIHGQYAGKIRIKDLGKLNYYVYISKSTWNTATRLGGKALSAVLPTMTDHNEKLIGRLKIKGM